MKLDPTVETARRLVSDTVWLGRKRGLSNPEAMREAAELLSRTESRVWTLLYRADTVTTVQDAELHLLLAGCQEALELVSAARRDMADYYSALSYAMLDGPELPLVGQSETHLSCLLRQTESKLRTSGGRPLWRQTVPKKRRWKRGSPGTARKQHSMDLMTVQASRMVQIYVDSLCKWGSSSDDVTKAKPTYSLGD